MHMSYHPVEKTILPEDYKPRSIDILCGRGRTWCHEGNKAFKKAIQDTLEKYVSTEQNFAKSLIVSSVVESLRDTGCLFVQQDAKTKQWYDIGDHKARYKTAHAFRDQHANRKKKQEKKNKRVALSSSSKKVNKQQQKQDKQQQKEDQLQQKQISTNESTTKQQYTSADLKSSLSNDKQQKPTKSSTKPTDKQCMSIESSPSNDKQQKTTKSSTKLTNKPCMSIEKLFEQEFGVASLEIFTPRPMIDTKLPQKQKNLYMSLPSTTIKQHQSHPIIKGDEKLTATKLNTTSMKTNSIEGVFENEIGSSYPASYYDAGVKDEFMETIRSFNNLDNDNGDDVDDYSVFNLPSCPGNRSRRSSYSDDLMQSSEEILRWYVQVGPSI